MAATYANIAAKTFDAGDSDLTEMSGGHSHVIGRAGGDWLYFNNGAFWGNTSSATPSADTKATKDSGGEKISVTVYTDVGGDPLPTIAVGGNPSPAFTHDAEDNLNGSTAGNYTAGLRITLGSSRINGGVLISLPITAGMQTFWWLGYSRNGVWSATISLSDSSVTPVVYNLPVSALNTNTAGYFEAQFRGTADQVTNGVTAEIKINRDGVGAGASGSIDLRGMVLRVPEAPARPRGTRPGRR